MKTAMQELIEYIESIPIVFNKELLLKIRELTFKEKDQIIDACWYGKMIKDEFFNPDEYYNENYNQNK